MVPAKTFRHVVDGEYVVESDLIVCSEDEWDASDKAHDPEWAVLRFGGEVSALRLRGIPSRLGHVTASAVDLGIPPID